MPITDADRESYPYKLGVAEAEIKRLRAALEEIKQATIAGRVCDDVAWFSSIETLHDFCERILEHSPDQLNLV